MKEVWIRFKEALIITKIRILLIYFYNSIWVILYIFISARAFSLSEQDINNITNNINNLKKHNRHGKFIKNKRTYKF